MFFEKHLAGFKLLRKWMWNERCTHQETSLTKNVCVWGGLLEAFSLDVHRYVWHWFLFPPRLKPFNRLQVILQHVVSLDISFVSYGPMWVWNIVRLERAVQSKSQESFGVQFLTQPQQQPFRKQERVSKGICDTVLCCSDNKGEENPYKCA